MRLDVLDHGHRPRVRAFLRLTSRLSGTEMADVPKTMLYRPEFFGAAMLGIAAPAMRGPSFWTPGEREYMAAFTAGLHRCPYCVETHTELVRIASRGEIDPFDPDSARTELVVLLPFIEVVSRAPAELRCDVLAPVRDAGVPKQAIVEALHVNLVWNTINRLANAFGFRLLDGQLHAGTRALHRLRYRFPRVLTGAPAVLPAAEGEGGTDQGQPWVASLRASVFEAPAHTTPATRSAAGAGDPLPEPLDAYGAMVRDASHRVSDDDVRRLIAAGHTEDTIFEITVAAAVGAALRSFDAGMACAEQGPGGPDEPG